MPELVEETWQHRRQSSTFRDAVSFRGDDLVLGLDTVLYPLGPEDARTISLRPDAAHDRMVALLAVAGHGRLVKAGLAQLTAALDDWRRGDRGLAAIRLAFAPLPRLRDRDDAHRLFLAETALDADVSPAALLDELGYVHCTSLLKFDPNQPRVPAGSGAPSGRWTSGAGGGATGTFSRPTRGGAGAVSGPASREPHSDAGSLRPTPVLFSETPEYREHTSPDAEWQRLDIGGDEKLRIEDGRPVLPPTIAPGAPTVSTPAVSTPGMPVPEGRPSSLTTPAPATGPQLTPAPGGAPPNSSEPDAKSRDRKGLACPAPQNDRPNGANLSGDEFEYLMSLLINPRNPTPKYSMATPNVISQAYYLPSPTPDGKTSFDDCKKDNTPTLLPIPDLKPGDLFEHKAAGWGWQLFSEGSAGFQQFDKQIKNQNEAVILEGRGRQIYYCLGEPAYVTQAQKVFRRRYANSHFLICH